MSWYIDSSAILSVILNEAEVNKISHLFRERLVTSTLSKVEVLRTVTKKEESLLPQARRLLDQFFYIEMDKVILQRASEYSAAVTLKTLDAIHLATAETIAPLIEGVITFDKQMAVNAQLLNLTVY